ncbi:hypothetical protein [Pseudanabaena galeata]|nr:hypothetical protein [Pseudanabaena galeata]WGS74825.1 hypothetical protein OA858_22785 [Pseudanabaena galeata CCNP1313]
MTTCGKVLIFPHTYPQLIPLHSNGLRHFSTDFTAFNTFSDDR